MCSEDGAVPRFLAVVVYMYVSEKDDCSEDCAVPRFLAVHVAERDMLRLSVSLSLSLCLHA